MGSGHTHAAPLAHTALGRLDARARILGIVPVVFGVNLLGTDEWRVIAVAAAAFGAGFALCGHGALGALKRGVYLLPFLAFALVTLPFAAGGNEVFAVDVGFTRLVATDEGLTQAAAVAMRGGTSILGILLLSATTEAPDLFRGLRSLGVPKAFVAVMAMIYRYLFEMGDELSRMRRAAAARGFEARSLASVPRMGSMAGALLMRSVARSENVHRAMLARGFDGEVRTLSRTRFGRREGAFLLTFYAALTTAALVVTYA